MENNFFKYKNIKSKLIIGEKKEDIFLSIVIPTYKREKLLEECLASILKQKLDFNYEIIIVDNDDNFENKEIEIIISKEKYKELNLLYYKNEVNLGPAGNWNRCIELANGKWITMIHDDDYFNENAIEKILECLKKYPDIGMFYFDYTIRDEIKNKIFYKSLSKETILILPQMFIFNLIIAAPLGATFKKEVLLKSGGFNENYYPSYDWEIILRVLKENKVILVENMNIITYRFSVNDSLNKTTQIGCALKDYEIISNLLRNYPIKNILLRAYLKRKTYNRLKNIDSKIEFEYLIKDKIEFFIFNKIFKFRKKFEKYYERIAKIKTKKYLKERRN